MPSSISGSVGQDTPTVLRSMLFVPTNVRRFTDKAHARGADAIILDLEDSIASAYKPDARRMLQDVAGQLRSRGVRQVHVRINSPLRHAIPDLEAVICPDVCGIVLAKTNSPEHVRMISAVIADLENERGMRVGTTAIGARVETAKAFFMIDQIASADPRITTLAFGEQDFCNELGVEPSVEVLAHPKQQTIIAARAAGVIPIGLVSSGTNFSDLDGMRDLVHRSYRFGFEGAACIHPAVVPLLNEGFRPSVGEIERAQRLLDRFYAAGSSASNFDREMIDYPIAYRAERILARKRAIDAMAA